MILAKIGSLDYKVAITIILIAVDLYSRIRINDFVQPIYFDSLLTLAVGFWFGASEKKKAS